jgi:molecular chaperone HtpG
VTVERREFQAEVKELLDLMVHSLYSNKDIFLRELVSNASDAIDRRRFAALTDPALGPDREFEILLETGSEPRRLSIRDNGIGMSRDELVQNLGTIARSGTREFSAKLREAAASGIPELIGQFGVGFYASFMVADRVEVLTRRAGETGAHRWQSSGDGAYTIESAERDEVGTTVTLFLKDADPEDGLQDYTEEWVLRQIVKRYSDFVAHPVRLRAGEAAETPETLNSMKAIWTRPESEVTDEEYKEFYKHISHDWGDPLERVAARMEGTFEAQALLFLPSRAPFDLYYRDMARRGVQLYTKRVFIMDDCSALLPEHFRFVKGVVDAEDVKLNVSREILQQDRQIRAIRTFLAKKVTETLQKLADERRADYAGFWKEFGACVKEGLLGFDEKKERLLAVALFASTHHESELTTLDEYVARMKDGQQAIYCALGPTRSAAASSPHLEAFRDKGYEVLLLTDQIDEMWLQSTPTYKEHKLQAVGKGEIDLPADEKKSETPERDFKDLLGCLRVHLQEQVKEVRLSKRLTRSAVCLVGEPGDLSPQMEDALRKMGRDVPRTKRILELNPDHPITAKLQERLERDPKAPELEQSARVLYAQALLAEGGQLADPAEFSALLSDVLVRAL